MIDFLSTMKKGLQKNAQHILILPLKIVQVNVINWTKPLLNYTFGSCCRFLQLLYDATLDFIIVSNFFRSFQFSFILRLK
jgi:hypothetical protein